MSSISSAYQRGDVFGFLEFLPPELLDLILNSLPPAEWHSGTLVLGWQALGFKHRRSRMYNKHANQGLDIKTGNEAGEPPSAAARLTQFREWLNKSLSTPAEWKLPMSIGPDGVSAIKSTILEHLPATRVRVHSRS
ncbi:hypothetical protein GQ42DRAFT_41712 [Ramicandelaber brevisporus]|nr:hypothetical protein GQ42DRAFT_41712 [Ramicandelaber brevisporus]